MLAPSTNRAPRFWVLAARSEPARSTKDSLPTFIFATVPEVLSLPSTTTLIKEKEKYKEEKCYILRGEKLSSYPLLLIIIKKK